MSAASHSPEEVVGLDEAHGVAFGDLPSPPTRAKTTTVVVMVATLLAASALAWSLHRDAFYALSNPVPIELGTLAGGELAPGAHDRYVRATVDPVRDAAIRARWLGDRDVHEIAPVAGADGVWVAYRVPASTSGPRFVPPSLVAGRLVRARDLGARYQGVASALERAAGHPPSWVLLDGVDPHSSIWVLGLEALLAAMWLWQAGALVRVLRRVP